MDLLYLHVYIAVDMPKIVRSFTSDTVVNDLLEQAIALRNRKYNTFKTHKRLFYCAHAHTRTHAHINVTL